MLEAAAIAGVLFVVILLWIFLTRGDRRDRYRYDLGEAHKRRKR